MAIHNSFKYILLGRNLQQRKILYSSRSLSSARPEHGNPEAAAPPAPAEAAVEPLVDRFGRRHDYLRISLTERCNLRCQYCMPAEGAPLSPREALLARDELLRLAGVFAALGVGKLRLTGGEPTLRADLVELVRELGGLRGVHTVAMTSNGLALARRLPALQRAGLSALNLSLDSLRAERYERMARRPGLPRVLASLDVALQLGLRSVKINTVLMKGFNEDEMCDFVELTRDRAVDVRFIEFMPFSGNGWRDERMVPERAALEVLRRAYRDLRPDGSGGCHTATMWRVPGYAGRVGFISSMSEPFCSSCSRLRLTADGNLKVCLFGSAETGLRDALRGGATDAELALLVRAALRRKHRQHAAGGAGAAPAPPLPPRRAARAPLPLRRQAARGLCTSALSHVDAEGRARMVDVSHKPLTARAAEAECYLVVGARLLRLLRSARLAKGDALTVAQVAGALAAKRTADLVPLCHPLPLELARVRVQLPRGAAPDAGGRVRLSCECRATARTGVEMEALTGCAVAALALYDMCKAVDRRMVIADLRVVRKTGGSSDGSSEGESGGGRDADAGAVRVRAHDTSPLRPDETYAPTDVAHF